MTVLPSTMRAWAASHVVVGWPRRGHGVVGDELDDDVVAGATVEDVGAPAADQHVVAGAAEERVVALAADEDVVVLAPPSAVSWIDPAARPEPSTTSSPASVLSVSRSLAALGAGDVDLGGQAERPIRRWRRRNADDVVAVGAVDDDGVGRARRRRCRRARRRGRRRTG